MNLNNIINNLKFYNFANPAIQEKFQTADLELAEIMLKRSRNLDKLTYSVDKYNQVSLLFVTEDPAKIKLLLQYDNSQDAFYKATSINGYHVLAKTNNEEKAKLIIDEYKDKYVLDHITGAVTFVEANSNAKIVKMLIEAGGSPTRGYFGKPVLESAQNLEKFKLLIDLGAKVNAMANDGKTLIEKLEESVYSDQRYIDELIKNKNFDPNFKREKDGEAIVFLLKDSNKLKIIEHTDFDFNTKNKEMQPLLYVFKDNSVILNKISGKINLESQSYNGIAPFFYLNDKKILDSLYITESLLSIRDKNNEKILFSTELSNEKFSYILDSIQKNDSLLSEKDLISESTNESLLIFLLRTNELTKFEEFVKQYPEEINNHLDGKGNNLLAYISNDEQFLKLVKDYGIDVYHKNETGGYSVLEGISKLQITDKPENLIELLDKKDPAIVDKLTSIYNKPFVVLNKEQILQKFEDKPKEIYDRAKKFKADY